MDDVSCDPIPCHWAPWPVKTPSSEADPGKAEVNGGVDSFSDAASIVDLILSRSSSVDAADSASLRSRADRLVLKLYASAPIPISVFLSMNSSVDCRSATSELSEAAENTVGIQHVFDMAVPVS